MEEEVSETISADNGDGNLGGWPPENHDDDPEFRHRFHRTTGLRPGESNTRGSTQSPTGPAWGTATRWAAPTP